MDRDGRNRECGHRSAHETLEEVREEHERLLSSLFSSASSLSQPLERPRLTATSTSTDSAATRSRIDGAIEAARRLEQQGRSSILGGETPKPPRNRPAAYPPPVPIAPRVSETPRPVSDGNRLPDHMSNSRSTYPVASGENPFTRGNPGFFGSNGHHPGGSISPWNSKSRPGGGGGDSLLNSGASGGGTALGNNGFANEGIATGRSVWDVPEGQASRHTWERVAPRPWNPSDQESETDGTQLEPGAGEWGAPRGSASSDSMSREALRPSDLDTGGSASRVGGGGHAVPTDGERLLLPEGCHNITLTKFLEVMTGPGLRVRKHHRKGKSGLRVLRYNEADDSLVWDSHKILGVHQHVLPLADIVNISMERQRRVTLLCVGGKDSYAIFETAKEDAATVLYVGLQHLQQRTLARARAKQRV